MQIHLFISSHASTGDRLKHALSSFRNYCTIIQYRNIETFGQEISTTGGEPIVAVIMVGNNEELVRFGQSAIIWDRFKTILILPDGEAYAIGLSHRLRPVFIDYLNSDFNNVVAVLDHIGGKSRKFVQHQTGL